MFLYTSSSTHTHTLFCFQNTSACVCSRLPPPSSFLTIFFRPFFSPPAGELRAVDAAGGLEGKTPVCVRALWLWWDGICSLLPSPHAVFFSGTHRLSRSGCLWPPSSVCVVPLEKQQWCFSVSTQEGHMRFHKAKNNSDGAASFGFTKRKSRVRLLRESVVKV